MLHCDAVCGGGAKREQWRLPHSPPDSSPPLRHPQSNWAPLVLVPEWVGLCTPRPLWVSPTTSPVRLRVSSAAASTPTGVFNQRFEALFPQAGAVGCAVCFSPPLFLPVYLCVNVGPQGLPATTLWGLPAAAWSIPLHNLPPHWVCQPPPCHKSSLPGCLFLPLLPVWMNVSSLSPSL